MKLSNNTYFIQCISHQKIKYINIFTSTELCQMETFYFLVLKIFFHITERMKERERERERERIGENISVLQTFPVTYFRVTKLKF